MNDKTLGRVLVEDIVFGVAYVLVRLGITLAYFGVKRLKETYR